MTQTEINTVFIKLAKRAEKIDPNMLVSTFVNVGPLFVVLDTYDNQVLFGRRGTGKTHAFKYLKEKRSEKDIVIYVDLRNIGSSGGIYSDLRLGIAERATRLLDDTLAEIHNELVTIAIENKFGIDLSILGPKLDDLATAITQVKVIGETETTSSDGSINEGTKSLGLKTVIDPKGLILTGTAERSSRIQESIQRSTTQKGELQHRVHFGELRAALQAITENINDHRILVLLDEWSAIPIDLQPYLADLLRRSLFPIPKITVKIAAIEKRSNFQIYNTSGDYIGIELGCDSSADANLDDYMLFNNDESRALEFQKQLLFQHFKVIAQEEGYQEIPQSSDDLIRLAFTQKNVFLEYVRASEAIPRDAFYILSYASQENFSNAISMNDIRKASKTWYQRDKESAVSANKKALLLLHWIIDQVIGERHSRAFLVASHKQEDLIDSLFDSRVLHLIKKNISTHDSPGQRYDVYKIDYGCYVELLSTSRMPQGLLELDTGGYIQVPIDDYRTIRRAILDVDEYTKDIEKKIG